MIRFQNFVSSRSCIQNPYAQLHHFAGIKSAALTFYSTLRTVANVLLDGQEPILEESCKCLFIQS